MMAVVNGLKEIIKEEDLEELIIEFGVEWSIAFAAEEPLELAKSIMRFMKADTGSG